MTKQLRNLVNCHRNFGAQINLSELNSLIEDNDMLVENLENWREQLLQEGLKKGMEKGREEGRMENSRETARNLISRTEMDDLMIAEIAGLLAEEVSRLRAKTRH